MRTRVAASRLSCDTPSVPLIGAVQLRVLLNSTARRRALPLSSRTQPDFSLVALHDALDRQRTLRGLSWAAVASEMNARFNDVSGHSRIAASTLAGVRRKSLLEGDGVLQMLLWLGRTPESFVPGFTGAGAARYRLSELKANQILRWDTRALYAALDALRQARGMRWQQVAAAIGGYSPASLTRLKKGGRISLPGAMRLVAWLDQPAAAFTRASDW